MLERVALRCRPTPTRWSTPRSRSRPSSAAPSRGLGLLAAHGRRRLPLRLPAQRERRRASPSGARCRRPATTSSWPSTAPGPGPRRRRTSSATGSTSPTTPRMRLVLLRDLVEHPRVALRADAVAELAAERGVGVSALQAEGDGPLARLAALVGTTDFASTYLALLRGHGPHAGRRHHGAEAEDRPSMRHVGMSAGARAGGGHGSTRAIIAALLANLAIAVAKFVGFLFTGSSSMLAESVHSVADSANQGLLLLGGKRARKAADAEHPFGYGRERYFWSFVVALVLFTLGGVFSLYEGVHKLQHAREHPEEVLESPLIAIGILLFAMVAEGFSFRTALKESRPLKGAAVLVELHPHCQGARAARRPARGLRRADRPRARAGRRRARRRHRRPRVRRPGHDGHRPAAARHRGRARGRDARAAARRERAAGTRSPRCGPRSSTASGITRVIHLKTMHLGPEELLVAAKVGAGPGHGRAAGRRRPSTTPRTRVRAAVPIARTMYLEPDLYRAEQGSVAASDPARHRDRRRGARGGRPPRARCAGRAP